MNIEFYKFFGKYKNLDEKGIDLLNSFFNEPEIEILLKEIDVNRQKRLKMFFLVLSLVFVVFIILFPLRFTIEFFLTFVMVLMFVLPLVFAITTGLAKYLWGDDTKTELIPKFVKKIDPQMTYRKTPDSGIWNIDFLEAGVKNGLLKSYHRVDKFEDTITYDILGSDGQKSITLRAVEIKTSVIRRSKKRTYRQVNNHAYVMKVQFSHPKMMIKKPISLKQDINDHIFPKLLTSVIGTTIIVFAALAFASPKKVGADGKMQSDLGAYLSSMSDTTTMIWAGIICAVFGGIFYAFQYFANRKRVKMENIDFEKRFDVYCEDPEQTRQLLTPSFMYRILDYIDKIDPKRVYTFLFDQDYFFVKYDILASRKGAYMELSSMRKIQDTLDDFVKFYLEVQGIKALIADLKLLYYDEKSISTQVID